MKKDIRAGLIAGLITILPSLVHAEDCCLPDYLPGEPLCDDVGCIYTQYAGVQLDCGWNVYAWGEFLYWRPVAENVWLTLKAENAIGGLPVLNSLQKTKSPYWKYKPAFSVGIGMHLPCFDDWIMEANYIWYHHDFKKSYFATAPAFLASVTAAGTPLVAPIYSSMTDKFDLDYDIVALNIKRPNYFGQRIILSPFLGLKWLHKKEVLSQAGLNTFTQLTDVVNTKVSNDSIGLGAGMDGSWLMCWHLRLIGKADVGILYAYRRRFFQRAIFTPPGSPVPLIVDLKQRDKHLDLLARGGLGFGWESYFCCNRYHLDLAVTYDFMSDVPKLSYSTGAMEGSSVLFMGLTIRGQFDF